MRDVSVED